jgi:hypothetical protein
MQRDTESMPPQHLGGLPEPAEESDEHWIFDAFDYAGLAPEDIVTHLKATRLPTTLARCRSKAIFDNMTLATVLRETRLVVAFVGGRVPKLLLDALTANGVLLPAILDVALTADPVKEARWAYRRILRAHQADHAALPCGLAMMVCLLLNDLVRHSTRAEEAEAVGDDALEVMWAQVAPVLPRLLSLVSTTLSTLVPLLESSRTESALQLPTVVLAVVAVEITNAMNLFLDLAPTALAQHTNVFEVRTHWSPFAFARVLP